MNLTFEFVTFIKKNVLSASMKNLAPNLKKLFRRRDPTLLTHKADIIAQNKYNKTGNETKETFNLMVAMLFGQSSST